MPDPSTTDPTPSPMPTAPHQATDADRTEPPAKDVTTLDVRWVRKMLLMILAAGAFSLWGLYDANVAYPARGAQVADYNLRELMRIAEQDNRLDKVSTPEPTKEIERLSVGTKGNDFDDAKFQWLDSLRLIGRLRPEHTTIADPVARRNELDAENARNPGRTKPAPLSAWDVPAQWAIFAVCGAMALYLLALFLKVKRAVYHWDNADKRLTLPGGASFTPADIAEFDKRKWDKFFITIRVKPEHPALGGKSVTLDLYRHAKLEGWVLEMEQASGLAQAADQPAPV